MQKVQRWLFNMPKSSALPRAEVAMAALRMLSAMLPVYYNRISS